MSERARSILLRLLGFQCIHVFPLKIFNETADVYIFIYTYWYIAREMHVLVFRYIYIYALYIQYIQSDTVI